MLRTKLNLGLPFELSEVTKALQQLDPVWEVLYPEEQSRVLELLVESGRCFQAQREHSFPGQWH